MRNQAFTSIVVCSLVIAGCSGSGSGNGGSTDVARAPAAAGQQTARIPGDSPEAAWMNEGVTPRKQPLVQAKTATAKTAGPSQAAGRTPAKPGPKSPDVSVLKLDASEVPASVRAIERVIDRSSALLADDVRIEVSKNYEWDVSLSGDAVMPQRPDRGGTFSEANGNARAYFRNLDIRARGKITVWRSGLGVTPFIKVYASGGVSYIDNDDASGKPRVKRAKACQITNARIAFDNELLGIPGSGGAQPTGDLKTKQ